MVKNHKSEYCFLLGESERINLKEIPYNSNKRYSFPQYIKKYSGFVPFFDINTDNTSDINRFGSALASSGSKDKSYKNIFFEDEFKMSDNETANEAFFQKYITIINDDRAKLTKDKDIFYDINKSEIGRCSSKMKDKLSKMEFLSQNKTFLEDLKRKNIKRILCFKNKKNPKECDLSEGFNQQENTFNSLKNSYEESFGDTCKKYNIMTFDEAGIEVATKSKDKHTCEALEKEENTFIKQKFYFYNVQSEDEFQYSFEANETAKKLSILPSQKEVNEILDKEDNETDNFDYSALKNEFFKVRPFNLVKKVSIDSNGLLSDETNSTNLLKIGGSLSYVCKSCASASNEDRIYQARTDEKLFDDLYIKQIDERFKYLCSLKEKKQHQFFFETNNEELYNYDPPESNLTKEVTYTNYPEIKLFEEFNQLYEFKESTKNIKKQGATTFKEVNLNTSYDFAGFKKHLSRIKLDTMINDSKKSSDFLKEIPKENIPEKETDERYKINLNDIIDGSDIRTTCMIKNIPNKYTQKMLIDLLNEDHFGCFDFVYLRMDFKNKCNVGYAFVNFIEPLNIVSFYNKANGSGWKKFSSNKIIEITYASIQGFENLKRKFKKSSVMQEKDSYRPKIFYSTALMAILYTQIKKREDNTILTGEFSHHSSSLNNTNDLLKELRNVTSQAKNSKEEVIKYESQDNRVSILVRVLGDLMYCVITDSATNDRDGLSYIDTIVEEFKNVYRPGSNSTYYSFDKVIKKMSSEFEPSKYHESMKAVDDTKGILADSLNLIIQRRENIDNLSKLANRMSIEAQYMQKNVRKMRLKSMFQDYGVYAVIIFVFFLFMYYITR